MSLRKKLRAIKKFLTKERNPYKKLDNYDPDNPFPKYYKTYKKYPQPEPYSGTGRKKRKGKGKNKKLKSKRKIGGKRRRKS